MSFNHLKTNMIPIQFITHHNERYGYLEGAQMALEAGCKWVQLRMKHATDDEIRCVAAQLLPLCRAHEAVCIIDDHVRLAKQLGADGVHLGKTDMPVAEARQILGHEFIIGGTANTFDDIVALHQAGADYIGCGPFCFTTTKERLAPTLGLDGYRHLMAQMRHAAISLPIVAIGGITRADIPDIMATGVHGIAVSGAVLRADDPVEEMRQMLAV